MAKNPYPTLAEALDRGVLPRAILAVDTEIGDPVQLRREKGLLALLVLPLLMYHAPDLCRTTGRGTSTAAASSIHPGDGLRRD